MSNYAIHYTDGSYLVYDLTKSDFELLKYGVQTGATVELTVGLLTTKDIRSVIIQKEVETIKEAKEQPAVPNMTMEEMHFLKQALSGIYEEEELD